MDQGVILPPGNGGRISRGIDARGEFLLFEATDASQSTISDFKNSLKALGLPEVFSFRIRNGNIQIGRKPKRTNWVLFSGIKKMPLYGRS